MAQELSEAMAQLFGAALTPRPAGGQGSYHSAQMDEKVPLLP